MIIILMPMEISKGSLNLFIVAVCNNYKFNLNFTQELKLEMNYWFAPFFSNYAIHIYCLVMALAVSII